MHQKYFSIYFWGMGFPMRFRMKVMLRNNVLDDKFLLGIQINDYKMYAFNFINLIPRL